jgi:hypothetical protein
MKNTESRTYEMLVRVREFGNDHRDVFPASSPGGQAFEALSAVLTRLAGHAVSRLTTTGGGTGKKDAAREALLESLDAVHRCARVIAEESPGFGEAFLLTRLRSNQAIIMTGRAFAAEAATRRSQFVACGMPETFVADLIGRVDAFEQAVRAWEAARNGQASARASIDSGLAAGLAVVRKLDICVLNQLRHDPATMAVWERNRRIERPRRARRSTPTPPVVDISAPPLPPAPQLPPGDAGAGVGLPPGVTPSGRQEVA